jgi:hypothetical protein
VVLLLVRLDHYSSKINNMATYGRGQMLGSGINPESFKLDYSGMANAAATQAQGVANLKKNRRRLMLIIKRLQNQSRPL